MTQAGTEGWEVAIQNLHQDKSDQQGKRYCQCRRNHQRQCRGLASSSLHHVSHPSFRQLNLMQGASSTAWPEGVELPALQGRTRKARKIGQRMPFLAGGTLLSPLLSLRSYRVGFRKLFFQAISSPGPAMPKGAGDQATVRSQPPFS